MLKYIITLCIVSFCISAQRVVNEFQQLILVQHSPITSFFVPLQNLNFSTNAIVEYLREHWMIFDPQTWIIHGLWPIDANSQNLTECKTSSGQNLTYNHEELHENFIEELKGKWPAITINGTEEVLWEAEYNNYGSCVSMSVSFYFATAVQLLYRYNIGNLLALNGILPGSSYAIDHILASLTEILSKQVYMKCMPAQNNQEQYLLEVHICFNKAFNLADCYTTGAHGCDTNRTVIYPGSRRN